MTSIIHKSPDAFTDATLPVLARDPRVNAGSQFRLDFTDAYTLNGLAAGAALSTGNTLKNLVDGKSNALSTSLSNSLVAPGGLGISLASASSNTAVYLGLTAGDFDMHDAGDHSFIVHLWANLDVTGQVLSSGLFGARSGTTNTADVTSPIWGAGAAPFYGLNGTDGQTPGAYSRAAGASPTISLASGALAGGAHLLSYAWTPGQASIYRDGVLAASQVPPSTTVPSTRSHATITAGGNVSAADTVAVNGTTITFVASGATGAQVNIGTDAAATLTNLKTYINANAATLNARAETTTGQAATVLTILHTGAAVLTLTKSAANLTLSSITNPYAIRLFLNAMKGKTYCFAMDDITVSGMTPAQAAAAEYASYRAKLTALGVA